MNNLQHMYQAWQQGNENYILDWVEFVEWASHQNNTTADSVMRELQKYSWFKWIPEE